jgi:hypothetical protein
MDHIHLSKGNIPKYFVCLRGQDIVKPVIIALAYGY